MAEKRMFTQKIIDSDAFLEMPPSAQALYFHLNMRADDDGFVNNPRKITRYVGAAEDDLKLLILKRFIIAFDSGVIVIKHWRMHNTLRMDRYKPTDYQEEFRKLRLKSNNAYTDKPPETEEENSLLPEWQPDGNQLATTRQPDGNHLEPQNRLEESREEKNRLEESNKPISEVPIFKTKDAKRIMEAWNSLGLQQLREIKGDTKRGGMLRARVNEYGVDAVLEAIENIRKSSFLKGQNGKGWTITFEWFVAPNNFIKVLEGNYDDTKAPAPQPAGKPQKRSQFQTAYEYAARPNEIEADKLAAIKAAFGM